MAGRSKKKDLRSLQSSEPPFRAEFEDISKLSPGEINTLAQNLRVHQVEMEAQLEELKATQQELSRSRDKYQELYDSIPVGYLTIDKQYAIREANATAAKMLDTTVARLLRSKFRSFIAPRVQSQDSFHLHAQKIWQTGWRQGCEVEMQRKDSSRFYAHLYTLLTGNVADKDSRLRIAITDITERKQAEEDILGSQRQTREILESIDDGFYAVDRTWRFTYVNERALSRLGLQPHDLIGHSLWEKFPFTLGTELELAYRRAMKNRQAQYFEAPATANRGWCLVSVYPSENGISIFWHDITERKQAEEALAKAKDELEIKVKERTAEVVSERQRLLGVLETLPAMVCLLTPDYHVAFANLAFRKTFGESNSRHCYEYCFDRDKPCEFCQSCRVLESGQPQYWEFTTHDGRVIDVRDFPFRDTGGTQLILKMKLDITESRKMEQTLKDYAQKITRVQEEERKRIAYELHDDTAQYLSILKLQLDSLIHSGQIRDSQVLEKLTFLEKDAGRAVDDVRRYSHELRPGVLEHLGLQAALEQIAEDINKLGYFSVEIEAEGFEPDLSEEVKLAYFRIAQEAINNTRKHAKASNAFINLRFTANHLKMVVSDDGIGFDVTKSASQSRGQGSLGMMSMQERANLIGAKINIRSQPGQGTRVTLEMPI
jgi:PAS domain S-box-containing protein